MRRSLDAAALLAVLALGCNPVGVKPVEESTGGGCRAGERCSIKHTWLSTTARLDLLFVIDNSGSMADAQAKLAAGLDGLVDELMQTNVDLDLHVGFTTTDMGNPWCPDSDPERGALVLSSCRDRVAAGEFLFAGVDPPIDGAAACTASCGLTDADLTIRPTTTWGDPEAKPRAWVELAGGQTNLPEAVDLRQALACFAPQGIAGCGFESHLESMYSALVMADEGVGANAGFLRDDARLAIVVLTDEADCSYNPAHEALFVSEKALWSDPDDPLPTSAVCWRAGVECVGDPSGYERCDAANVGVDGSVGVADEDAALHPVARYVDYLNTIENRRRMYDSGAEVQVTILGGVPEGYAAPEDLTYSAAGDPTHLDLFGVDPGCVDSEGAAALPPVRLRELAESLQIGDRVNLASSCAADYTPALTQLGAALRRLLPPACMPECVADTDPDTDILDPECVLTDTNAATGESTALLPCDGTADDPSPPEGETSCFVYLVDPGGLTPTTADDLSARCADYGWNLEFRIIRKAPLQAGMTTRVNCQLSDLPVLDCPDL
ncbi:MAG: VWA domain-containing protein [Myxococcales bacterium]|nr:VWA domain-containing protein [Myxococcales bacterium]